MIAYFRTGHRPVRVYFSLSGKAYQVEFKTKFPGGDTYTSAGHRPALNRQYNACLAVQIPFNYNDNPSTKPSPKLNFNFPYNKSILF